MALYEIQSGLTHHQNYLAVAHAQLDLAIESLTTKKDIEKGIYAARKCMKRLRGLARLYRAAVEDDVFRAHNARYRDIAQMLGDLRDAWVKIEILEALSVTVRPLPGYAELMDVFQREYDALTTEFLDPKRYQQVLERLEEAKELASTWEVNAIHREDRYRVLHFGIKQAYRQVRRRWTTIKKSEFVAPEVLHEWRKRVKHLWYELTLIQPVAPDLLQTPIAVLDELGDTLGKAHDWSILEEMGRMTLGDEPRYEPLWEAIREEREASESRARELATEHLKLRSINEWIDGIAPALLSWAVVTEE